MSVCLFTKARIPKKMASELEDEVAFDESISELVRAHPCLYDKRNRDYKDRNINMDAWASVAGKLALEDGETAKRLFKNLKKRYNKRRNHLKKAECSGTSAVTVSLAKEKVEEFRFLAWLNPFIRQRRTKASLLKKQEWAEVSKAENVSNVEGNYKASESRQQDCSNDFEDVNFPTVNGIPSTSHERKRPTESPMSVVTGRKKWGKETPSLDEVDHSFLASAKRAIETPTQDDEGVFGMLVASDLRKLNQFNKMIARNRIQNLLFELQLQEQGQLQCPKQSTPNSMAQNNP